MSLHVALPNEIKKHAVHMPNANIRKDRKVISSLEPPDSYRTLNCKSLT